jgi:hypothetical protein
MPRSLLGDSGKILAIAGSIEAMKRASTKLTPANALAIQIALCW